MKRIILAVALVAPASAPAYQITPASCPHYAMMVWNLASVRDMDADKAKHWAWVAKVTRGQPKDYRRLLEREFERVYRLNGITAEDLKIEALRRCEDNLGDLGEKG